MESGDKMLSQCGISLFVLNVYEFKFHKLLENYEYIASWYCADTKRKSFLKVNEGGI
jgi:hypothetical protein